MFFCGSFTSPARYVRLFHPSYDQSVATIATPIAAASPPVVGIPQSGRKWLALPVEAVNPRTTIAPSAATLSDVNTTWSNPPRCTPV
jgi:hypothetical protein